MQKSISCRSRRTAFDENKKESRCLHLLSSFAQTLLASGRNRTAVGGGVKIGNPLRRLDARTILEVLRGGGLHILGRPLAVGDRFQVVVALKREGHATPVTGRRAGGLARLARRLGLGHLGNRRSAVTSEVAGNLLDDLGLDLAEASEHQTIGLKRLVIREDDTSLTSLNADSKARLPTESFAQGSVLHVEV